LTKKQSTGNSTKNSTKLTWIDKFDELKEEKDKRIALFSNHLREGINGKAKQEHFYSLLPHTDFYYTPIPRIFLIEFIDDPSFITKKFDFLISRDGVINTAIFFTKYPKPTRFKKLKIIIPLPFSFLVPKAWEKNILYYQCNFKKQAEDLSKPVALVGSADGGFYSLDYLENAINKLKTIIPKGQTIHYSMNLKHNSFSNIDFDFGDFSARSIFKIMEMIGSDYNINNDLPINYALKQSNISHVNYYYINEKHLCLYDDYIPVKLAKQHCLPINEPYSKMKVKGNTTELEIYDFLSYTITDTPSTSVNRFNEINKAIKFFDDGQKTFEKKINDSQFSRNTTFYYLRDLVQEIDFL
jgi:hypothetical protein